jgi:arginase
MSAVTPRVALLGAPSNIGIRPHDDGTLRHLDAAPAALRAHGLVAAIGAQDQGDVHPPPYRDVTRPAGRPRNEEELLRYSRALASRLAGGTRDGARAMVIGGDCSIVLGCLLGLRGGGRRLGLVYIDAHADFASPLTSGTGSAASMCLALAVGLGDTPLARLAGDRALVRGEDAVLIGRRDDHDAAIYGHDVLAASGVLDVPDAALRTLGIESAAHAALGRVTRAELDGFWIHFDADVLDPRIMPAVDSPEPGGLSLRQAAQLLGALVRHPRALGLELTIYDPGLDSAGEGAARLVRLLTQVWCGAASGDDPGRG